MTCYQDADDWVVANFMQMSMHANAKELVNKSRCVEMEIKWLLAQSRIPQQEDMAKVKLVKLRYAVYDLEGVFNIEFATDASVEVLQEKIFAARKYGDRFAFHASEMKLYLAKKDGVYMKVDDDLENLLKNGDVNSEFAEMWTSHIVDEYLGKELVFKGLGCPITCRKILDALARALRKVYSFKTMHGSYTTFGNVLAAIRQGRYGEPKVRTAKALPDFFDQAKKENGSYSPISTLTRTHALTMKLFQ